MKALNEALRGVVERYPSLELSDAVGLLAEMVTRLDYYRGLEARAVRLEEHSKADLFRTKADEVEELLKVLDSSLAAKAAVKESM